MLIFSSRPPSEPVVLSGEDIMIGKCKNCGCTESQAVADAKTLGLQEEFQRGIYTCCQIAGWAHEQWSAWFEATQQDVSETL